jgi:hypothetical protein
MADFLYFLPNENAINQTKLADAGLAHAFEATPARGAVASGPDGTPGLLLSQKAEKVGFSPENQTWRRFPRGTAWVGFWNDEPPTPAELIRKSAISGHALELLDGREWIVPVTRRWRKEGDELRFTVALPRPLVLNSEGEWISGDVVPAYRQLWEIGAAWLEKIGDAAPTGSALKLDTEADVIEAAVAALAANYRVSRHEVAALELLSLDAAHLVLDYLVDFPGLEEISKKNLLAPVTSPTAAG